MTKQTRRNLLKGLAVSAPAAWSTPLVTSVILPAHAQTSPCGPSLSCSTGVPVSDTDGESLSGSGSNWGFNSDTAGPTTYEALIDGLQAQACPGTDVSISIVDGSGDGFVSVSTGQNVPADGSGVASFTERVRVTVTPSSQSGGDPVNFTLRFTSDDGSGPCDIPFCFTEFSPGACGKVVGP